jgi:hypothetical protein
VHEEVAWNSFSYWLERYATLGRDQIKARRRLESDWTYYENFEQLSNRFAVLDARKRKLKALPTLSDELLAKFLEEEVEEES